MTKLRSLAELVACATLAGVAAAGVQDVVPSGWWLNSQFGVAITTGVVALVSLVVSPTTPGTHTWWIRTGGVLAGATVALVLVLFRIGPGTIFPLVIMFGIIPMLTAATLCGWACRFVWREWRRGRLVG